MVIASVVAAKGAFTGVGRIVEVPNLPADPDAFSRDDLVFAGGSIHIVSTSAGKARHHGDRCRMSCRELLLGVSARGPEGAVTALVRAVPAAGIAVRPLEKS
jgi:hypothetical protein